MRPRLAKNGRLPRRSAATPIRFSAATPGVPVPITPYCSREYPMKVASTAPTCTPGHLSPLEVRRVSPQCGRPIHQAEALSTVLMDVGWSQPPIRKNAFLLLNAIAITASPRRVAHRRIATIALLRDWFSTGATSTATAKMNRQINRRLLGEPSKQEVVCTELAAMSASAKTPGPIHACSSSRWPGRHGAVHTLRNFRQRTVDRCDSTGRGAARIVGH